MSHNRLRLATGKLCDLKVVHRYSAAMPPGQPLNIRYKHPILDYT